MGSPQRKSTGGNFWNYGWGGGQNSEMAPSAPTLWCTHTLCYLLPLHGGRACDLGYLCGEGHGISTPIVVIMRHRNPSQHTGERGSTAGFEAVSRHVGRGPVRGLRGREPWWPAESDSPSTASKRKGTSVPQLKGTEFCQEPT